MKNMLSVLGLCLSILISHAQTKPVYNKTLADSLAQRVKIDQMAAGLPQGKFTDFNSPGWQNFKDSVFETHKRLLDDIYKKYGYPGKNLVGEQGAHFYWLMVQHCDKHPDFQQKILVAMKKQVDKGNATAIDYAYLTDRVALNTGKKQLYGTQLTYNTKICQAYPRPVDDSVNLNSRRKAIKLPPIEQYLNELSESHFVMNQASYEAKGVKGPKLYIVPKW